MSQDEPKFRLSGDTVETRLSNGEWARAFDLRDLRGANLPQEADRAEAEPAPTAEAKPWWQSRTIIGAGIAGASVLGGIGLGFSLDAETQKVVADQTVAFVTAGAALGGTLVAIYGRFKATRPVTLGKPKT